MKVSVGIVSAEVVRIDLLKPCVCNGQEYQGEQEFRTESGRLYWRGVAYDTLCFMSDCSSLEPVFCVHDAVIGIDFHWERCEDQVFGGNVRLVIEDGKVRVVNDIDIEDYLVSVISSEMNSNASLEFLKAHAVISRSWVMTQILNRNAGCDTTEDKCVFSPLIDNGRHIVWYDRDSHSLFDVCADDHCQRYQGLTRVTNPLAREAVMQTEGEVLMYGDNICDARFSKCCGGMMEKFSVCWSDRDFPYLQSVPDKYCNTRDWRVLSQVLNSYDQETLDFYRWTVRYTQEEIAGLIREKSGVDFGQILSLVPLKRGLSGRIFELEIVGTKFSQVIGKELEIRKWFSKSHLYSSAFDIKTEYDGAGADIPSAFVFEGKGWGHGVGLCQIGAAVMGDMGYNYQKILSHYYPGAYLDKFSLV